ncbi:hypothetical protein G7Y89_g12206 [Cudoniella acicularis]|uniref:Heterokaryon incompatibility domain-containing protein n=1 Tax=Cudoniella acicularis TaxID=354080 RepID=A0A8H4RD12_9HELO|nr:hypothetical protein G7Y89_g12206 [Cudoniella acicularis]
MEYDTKRSLENIRDKGPSPLSSMLVEIQAHKEVGKKSGWIESLECLKSTELPSKVCFKNQERLVTKQEPKFLRRETINAIENRDFVAVSYPWEPSSTSPRDIAIGGYQIESSTSKDLKRSEVRDIVLDRVIKYTKHCPSNSLFWIDKECIDQDDPRSQADAIQSMDQVYGCSKYPVGLLSVYIKWPEDIDLLVAILNEDFTTNGYRELSRGLVSGRSKEALDLLHLLASDKWWDRAWIFQEEYCSTTRMKLLIPHCQSLEGQKRNAGATLGNIPGEICFSVVEFRKRATEFCLFYRRYQPRQKEVCRSIIERVERYTLTLPDKTNRVRRAMSPFIYSGISNRGIKDPSDLLPIAANCCEYSTRLDSIALHKWEYSLSLAILTQYFLNGEIIWNDRKNGLDDLRYNVFDFLKKKSFNKFDHPFQDKELSGIKNCRFHDVTLSQEGVKTTGQLWKLGKVIDSGKVKRTASNCLRTDSQPQILLKQLAKELRLGKHGQRYESLASYIDNYSFEDSKDGGQYKALMVNALCEAIHEGKSLRLGLAYSRPNTPAINKMEHRSYCAVFISSGNRGWQEKRPSYIFTSYGSQKYVSLEVELDGSTKNNKPRLITKGWVNGLCLSNEHHDQQVLFLWPPSLA